MIIFQEVTKAFGDQSFAVRDVTFEIEPGELVFITGSSGSGKTTLMRLLTKEYTPTSGEIFFEDTPLSQIGSGKMHEHRRRIGVVFQDYRLLPELNVWENVALPLYVIGKKEHEVEERVTDLLKLVQLTDKADLFPSQLSGGEAQRISIARALAIGPEVIFADEPTGNLDPETADHIAHLLLKINELGTTVLFATHDRRLMEQVKAHRHLHLENGELLVNSLIKAKGKGKKAEEATKPPHSKQSAADDRQHPDQEDASQASTAELPEDSPEEVNRERTQDDKTSDQAEKKPKTSFWNKILGKKKPVKEAEESEESSPQPDPDHKPTKSKSKQTKTAVKTEDLEE